MTPTAPPKPCRLTVREAAAILRIHPVTLRGLVNRGLFTVVPYRDGKRGIGQRYFLLPDEIEIYGTQGEHALRQYRLKTRRLKR